MCRSDPYADLRFRRGRLRIEVDGPGPIRAALVNGIRLEPRQDGVLAVPADFREGRIQLITR